MDIRFIGTGGAFDVAYGNASAIVDCAGTRFLLDCGHAVFPALVRSGLAGSIDVVIVTHLHDDHVGSLSTLLFYHTYILQKGLMTVAVPSQDFLDELLEFLTHAMQVPLERARFVMLSDYPQVKPIDTFGQHVPGMRTWGFAFHEGDRAIAYTGDNGDAKTYFEKLEALGLPVTDVFSEIFWWPGIRSHTYYKDLEPYLERYRIWGYHCDPKLAPADNRIPLVAEQPQFLI